MKALLSVLYSSVRARLPLEKINPTFSSIFQYLQIQGTVKKLKLKESENIYEK